MSVLGSLVQCRLPISVGVLKRYTIFLKQCLEELTAAMSSSHEEGSVTMLVGAHYEISDGALEAEMLGEFCRIWKSPLLHFP